MYENDLIYKENSSKEYFHMKILLIFRYNFFFNKNTKCLTYFVRETIF